jgi:hypothetical protein
VLCVLAETRHLGLERHAEVCQCKRDEIGRWSRFPLRRIDALRAATTGTECGAFGCDRLWHRNTGGRVEEAALEQVLLYVATGLNDNAREKANDAMPRDVDARHARGCIRDWNAQFRGLGLWLMLGR